MFVVVCRMRIKPGAEAEYEADWRDVTQVAIDRFGSGGSALFKEADGTYVAIARWRTREDRQAFFDRTDFDPVQRQRQRDAVLESLPPLELDLVDDVWVPFTAIPA